MSDSILVADGLSAYYGQFQVLHGVDFQLGKGGITTLLGANGAGKTTTLRALCQMVRTQGSVSYFGKPIHQMRTESIVRLGIAHVPDGRGTFTGLTVEENLLLGAYTRGDRHAIAADLDRMYRYFPRLKERYRQQAGTLSGGEQQMLAISRALMLKPRLLLLDEPSFGLAPKVVLELFGLISTVNEQEGVTILLVEQNAALSMEIATYVYLMDTGRIVLSGTAKEVQNDDMIRTAYLGN